MKMRSIVIKNFIMWGIDIYVKNIKKKIKSCSPLCQTYNHAIPMLIIYWVMYAVRLVPKFLIFTCDISCYIQNI